MENGHVPYIVSGCQFIVENAGQVMYVDCGKAEFLTPEFATVHVDNGLVTASLRIGVYCRAARMVELYLGDRKIDTIEGLKADQIIRRQLSWDQASTGPLKARFLFANSEPVEITHQWRVA